MSDLPPGTLLENRYKILRSLGQGGMGAVYLAEDQRLSRRCAAKMAFHTDPAAEAQFRREAAILADLHHPNLPRVTDYFAQGNRYFLVMDYVRGQDFSRIVHLDGPLPESKVLRWLPQVLDALEYLHNQQPQPIIHRDIKPANLKLTREGRVMLVDFGIAKRHDPQMSTVVGARAYSPGFSPPEQYGRGHTDARSDIFSLGATLYYLLTGIVPTEALDRIAGVSELVPPREYNSRISPATEHVILKAMALNRNERFASVREMRQALPAAESTTPVGLPGAGRRANRLVPAVVAIAILLLAVGLAAFGAWRFVQGTSESPPVVVVATGTSPAAVVNPTLTKAPASPTLAPTQTEAPAGAVKATSTLRPTPTPSLTFTPRPPTWTPTIRPTSTLRPTPTTSLTLTPRPPTPGL